MSLLSNIIIQPVLVYKYTKTTRARRGEDLMSEDFPARLFPSSFTLLYCPFAADGVCTIDTPFADPYGLVEHCDEAHQLVISKPGAVIPFLDRYLAARKFIHNPTDAEDEALRNQLQQVRLREILDMQAKERSTTRLRGRHCLFCDQHCINIRDLFHHMLSEHYFNIGHVDNLVMVSEFLDYLQAKLDAGICIYCEGQFPNRSTLRKHIKNKFHYRIHPQNHIYDKYYIVNYMQPGKLYDPNQQQQFNTSSNNNDVNNEEEEEEEEEWGYLDELVIDEAMCLLCPMMLDDAQQCLNHMRDNHGFDLPTLIKDLEEEEAIQLVNFMRSRQIELQCPWCNLANAIFFEQEELSAHLRSHHPQPRGLPQGFQNVEFLFPILEGDSLIWSLPRNGGVD